MVEDAAGPGQLQNVVDIAPFLKVRAIASCMPDKKAHARDKTLVNITEARVELFGLRCGVECSDWMSPNHVSFPCTSGFMGRGRSESLPVGPLARLTSLQWDRVAGL